jgi:hypothetical protein
MHFFLPFSFFHLHFLTAAVISSNTPDPAIYILTGLLPIEAQIHIKALTLFGNVCRQDEACIEKQLAIRQLRVQSMNSNSSPKMSE